jgi:hypothetical protein
VRAVVSVGFAVFCLAAPASAAALSRDDRTAIDQTIDRFVSTAVRHQNVAASYDLVTPQLRGGMSRAAWARGNIPVYPYPARGSGWHGWTVDYALKDDVAFELLLQPRRGSRLDPISFSGEVKKIHGRWLVDSFYPAASFAAQGAKVVGPRDFGAPPFGDDSGNSVLGTVWFAVPVGVLALIALVPLTFFLANWRRGRRAARAYAGSADRKRYDEFWERLGSRGSESG